jgi:hypothetical protein
MTYRDGFAFGTCFGVMLAVLFLVVVLTWLP